MFDRKPGAEPKPQPLPTIAPRSGQRPTDQQSLATVLGPNARFNGEISGKTDLEILGTLEGTCQIEGLLHICEGGSVVGDVNATDVVVEGRIQGNLKASNKLELRATSRIEGDIRSSKMQMDEGCLIKGNIDMSDAGESRPPSTKLKEQRAIGQRTSAQGQKEGGTTGKKEE